LIKCRDVGRSLCVIRFYAVYIQNKYAFTIAGRRWLVPKINFYTLFEIVPKADKEGSFDEGSLETYNKY